MIEQLCQLVLEAQNGRPDALERSRVNVALTAWAQRHGVYPEWSDERDTARRATSRSESRWADFLIRFDHEYRSRRLRFVIRELNTLYVRLEEPEFEGLTPQRLDEVKEALYNALELLQTSRNPDFLAPDVRETLAHFDWEAEALEQVLGPTLDRIAADIDLRSFNDAVDRIFGVLVAELPRAPRRVLLVAYLGFAFWDVLAFTMTSWRSLGEYDEIRVDRISPEDANSLREGGAAATLKGIGLEHFAAFFSRTHRENDYLWGRLHAAERLIDIVCDAAGAEHAGLLAEAKRDAFIAVLHAERGNLPRCDALIDALLRELGAATPVQPAPAAPSTGPGADDLVGQPAGS